MVLVSTLPSLLFQVLCLQMWIIDLPKLTSLTLGIATLRDTKTVVLSSMNSGFVSLIDLPLLNYFNLGYYSFHETTSITLKKVPFTNGQHIQNKRNNRYEICNNLTSSGIVCDSGNTVNTYFISRVNSSKRTDSQSWLIIVIIHYFQLFHSTNTPHTFILCLIPDSLSFA